MNNIRRAPGTNPSEEINSALDDVLCYMAGEIPIKYWKRLQDKILELQREIEIDFEQYPINKSISQSKEVSK